MSRTQLEMEAVIMGLAGRGVIATVGPALEKAIESLSGQPDAELGDLLIRLVQQGDASGAHEVLREAARLDGERTRALATLAEKWRVNGRQPNTAGYVEARREVIASLVTGRGDDTSTAGLDERVVEYPWLFWRLGEVHEVGERVLDAGSILNHREIVDLWRERSYGPTSIVTLQPEAESFPHPDVRYEYADLRALPYRDHLFGTVLSLSTLEHVGMDNGIYGAARERAASPESEVAKALMELRRVVRPGGRILWSVPCGEPSDRGWFRVLEVSEVERLASLSGLRRLSVHYLRCFEDGWAEVEAAGVEDAGYNERPGVGRATAPQWVAAAEAVALVELERIG